jgi:hypothetical protein
MYNTALLFFVIWIVDLIQSDGWCHQHGILVFVTCPTISIVLVGSVNEMHSRWHVRFQNYDQRPSLRTSCSICFCCFLYTFCDLWIVFLIVVSLLLLNPMKLMHRSLHHIVVSYDVIQSWYQEKLSLRRKCNLQSLAAVSPE